MNKKGMLIRSFQADLQIRIRFLLTVICPWTTSVHANPWKGCGRGWRDQTVFGNFFFYPLSSGLYCPKSREADVHINFKQRKNAE